MRAEYQRRDGDVIGSYVDAIGMIEMKTIECEMTYFMEIKD